LILGSASRDLLRQSSETLAGRICYIELTPFSVHEVGTDQTDNLWLAEDKTALMFHPKLGPSWEGFAVESIIRSHKAGPGDCYFWSTHAGAELDLLVFESGRRIGYEIKHTDAPRMTRSLGIAQTDLKIDDLYVVYPGSEQFPLDDRIYAAGLQGLVQGERER
jgi:predicted AAA+ superfamily ATPase